MVYLRSAQGAEGAGVEFDGFDGLGELEFGHGSSLLTVKFSLLIIRRDDALKFGISTDLLFADLHNVFAAAKLLMAASLR